MLRLLQDGGLFFMLPILFIFIAIVVLFVKELISKKNRAKTISLIASLSLFVAVWGILGQSIGLISAFDAVEAGNDLTMSILACGLKISFLPTVFGLFTFLVGRLAIIVLTVFSDTSE